MTKFQGDQSKISIYTMKINRGAHYFSNLDKICEIIFSTRLEDETFRGTMNFMHATKSGTSKNQIQNALVSHKSHYIEMV